MTGSERLLSVATAGLPPGRAEWGAAMRAEVAAIDDPGARRRFARSAAWAAFRRGLGLSLAIALGAGVAVALATLIASRIQLPDARPGVLSVTFPFPTIVLIAVATWAAATTQSFRFGLQTALLALVACFVAVATVVAVEGLVWMDRHGVFILDADPPRGAATDSDVIFDLFTTGMWLGHVLFWLPCTVVFAALGARRRSAA